MAGHSKWANIKHRKGRQDALRGKMNTKYIREITVATKEAGADPNANPRLRLAIDKANRANVTKDSIKRAIDKGMGKLAGVDYQEVCYEGYGPNGIAMLVNCLTDNKNRTVAEIRHAFNKYGGNLGTDGSVRYLFVRKGVVVISGSVEDDALLLWAIDSGIDNVSEGIHLGTVALEMAPNQLAAVVDRLKTSGYTVVQADYLWIAEAKQILDEATYEKYEVLYDVLLDLDDVQAVFSNAKVET